MTRVASAGDVERKIYFYRVAKVGETDPSWRFDPRPAMHLIRKLPFEDGAGISPC